MLSIMWYAFIDSKHPPRRYSEVFLAEEICDVTLQGMSEEELKSVGIRKFHIKHIKALLLPVTAKTSSVPLAGQQQAPGHVVETTANRSPDSARNITTSEEGTLKPIFRH